MIQRERIRALLPLLCILLGAGALAIIAAATGPHKHAISPVLFEIGIFQVRYYGLVYMLGFILVYILLRCAVKKGQFAIDIDSLERFVLMLVAGVIIGSRLFEVLIYNPSYYFANPLEIVQVWKGGLSFHGGLVGVVIACWWFSHPGWLRSRPKGVPVGRFRLVGRFKKASAEDGAAEGEHRKPRPSFAELCDFLALPALLMLAFGRLANFINGELYGGPSMLPWAVAFGFDGDYRHPVQLYESVSNAISFGILFFIRSLRPQIGILSGCFLILYGGFRFCMEFFKDYAEYGYETLQLGAFHVAHILCFLMVACGAYIIFSVFRKRDSKQHTGGVAE